MRYDSDLLYRPPGEWRSYLLQCTIGCSHNKCTFCAMYKEKKFRVRPVEEILEDIDMARSYYGPNVERVFLMDGDAIVMRTEQLLQILKKLYAAFPKLQKVTTYAGPRSTPEQDAGGTARPAGGRTDPGLSGGGERQRRSAPGHPKGCTAAEMLQAGQNLVAAGIDLWAIVILGLTGQGGRLGGARPVHRRHHQQNEAPPPLSHDFLPLRRAPRWGRTCWPGAFRCVPRTRSWRSATFCWSTWMWTPSTSPATTPPTTCP